MYQVAQGKPLQSIHRLWLLNSALQLIRHFSYDLGGHTASGIGDPRWRQDPE